MVLGKIIASAILGLSLSAQLMAGNNISQEMIASAKKWDVKGITPQALKALLDKEEPVYMLDVREPYMIPEGSIDGTENVAIARGLLEFDAPTMIEDKNAFIVVYCRSGKGAVLAAKTMKQDLKYKNVYYLEGGIDGWLEAGYSIFSHFGEMQLAK
jgi:rhodanese-related sulfurtransferase